MAIKVSNFDAPFLTAKQKQADDNQLIHDYMDHLEGSFSYDKVRSDIIRENWNLHNGQWPELELIIADQLAIKGLDGKDEYVDLTPKIVHNPKIVNVTRTILGGMISQKLVPGFRDHSMKGRKFREEKQLERLQSFYYENVYMKKEESIKSQYFQENGITDVFSLSPEEQQQIEADLRQRVKSGMPQDMVDDLKRIQTPTEVIKSILLNYDIKDLGMVDKFTLGAEQAVVTFEEYYRILRRGNKPVMDLLESEQVIWGGSKNCLNAEDGSFAKYTEWLSPHDFIRDHGHQVMKDKKFLENMEELFTDIPSFGYSDEKYKQKGLFSPIEGSFVDLVGEFPELIQNDWRTNAGQQDIANIYSRINILTNAGKGIPRIYMTWKWTETIGLLRRNQAGVIKEYTVSANYRKDKSMGDISLTKYPINKVYHGYKAGGSYYLDCGAVENQYLGTAGVKDPKLTIFGNKYNRSMGYSGNATLMCAMKHYQLKYDITASKAEELEKSDLGNIILWNSGMKPEGWSDGDFMKAMVIGKNVPYSTNKIGMDRPGKPLEVVSTTGSVQETYEARLERREKDIYAAAGLNRDAMGYASQYASNDLVQSNINASSKQLRLFDSKRSDLKKRVLSYFTELSLACLLDDEEKQLTLLDEFARYHIDVNRLDILSTPTQFSLDDGVDEEKLLQLLQSQLLPLLQNGSNLKDITGLLKSKSVAEIDELAEIADIRRKEREDEVRSQTEQAQEFNTKMIQQVEKMKEDFQLLRDRETNATKVQVATINSELMSNANDIDKDNVNDHVKSKMADIESRERIAKAKLELEREKIKKMK